MPNISIKKFVDVFRHPATTPTYVLNVLTYSDFRSYRRYAMFATPMIAATGGSVPWGGNHEESIVGERLCGTLLLVRYLNHRRFMVMIATPIFVAINALFRENGVASFEAAFSRALVETRDKPERRLLAIHFNARDAAARFRENRRRLSPLGCVERYAFEEFLTMDFFDPPAANDPNPHTFKATQLFALPDGEPTADIRDELGRIGAELGDCGVHLYRRINPKHYLPGTPVPQHMER